MDQDYQPLYSEEEIIYGIANHMIITMVQDNGAYADCYKFYVKPGYKELFVALQEAVKLNMPLIDKYSEDDLAILSTGDPEEALDRSDIRPGEEEIVKAADRYKVITNELPHWQALNKALEDCFNGPE